MPPQIVDLESVTESSGMPDEEVNPPSSRMAAVAAPPSGSSAPSGYSGLENAAGRAQDAAHRLSGNLSAYAASGTQLDETVSRRQNTHSSVSSNNQGSYGTLVPGTMPPIKAPLSAFESRPQPNRGRPPKDMSPRTLLPREYSQSPLGSGSYPSVDWNPVNLAARGHAFSMASRQGRTKTSTNGVVTSGTISSAVPSQSIPLTARQVTAEVSHGANRPVLSRPSEQQPSRIAGADTPHAEPPIGQFIGYTAPSSTPRVPSHASRPGNAIDDLAGPPNASSFWNLSDPPSRSAKASHRVQPASPTQNNLYGNNGTSLSASTTQAHFPDFSVSLMKPRFGLTENDSGFHSKAFDRFLIDLFKNNLTEYLRERMAQYRDRLSTTELIDTAIKHARYVFKKVQISPQLQKRKILSVAPGTGIAAGFERKLQNRAYYLQRKSNSGRPNPQSEQASSFSTAIQNDEESTTEEEIQEDSDDSEESDTQGVDDELGESLQEELVSGLRQEVMVPRRRKVERVNYNVKELWREATKRGRISSDSDQETQSQPQPQKRRRLVSRSEALADEIIEDISAPKVAPKAAARPKGYSRPVLRSSLLRGRELGYSHYGSWTNERGLQQDLERLMVQDYEPWRNYAGASKDILTAIWAPNGTSFVLGTSTEMDDLNIQYNRPNNLLYGETLTNSIYELPDHYIDRPRPETISSGSNALQDTYNAVDPRLFATVTSLAFDGSGKTLYTGSFDGTVKIWDVEGKERPSCTKTLRHNGKVALLGLSLDSELLASAQYTDEFPIQVFHSKGEYELVQRYHPTRNQKEDLRLHPSALLWGNQTYNSNLLVAGFAENKFDEDERDREGYIGLWDVVTGAHLRLTPCTQAIFDLAWSPSIPILAAASTTGNRLKLTDRWNTKSLVRTYSPLEGPSCREEYECPALDINEVRFHPKDPNYITASCTDGVTYMWDNRKSDTILHRFCHGEPHDPLKYTTSATNRLGRAGEREELDTGVRFSSWDQYGTRLYTGSSDGLIKIWDHSVAPEDAFVKDLAEFDSNVMAAQFSPDFTNLLVGTSKGSVQVLTSAPPSCEYAIDGSALPSTDAHFKNSEMQYKPAPLPPQLEEEDELAGTHRSQHLVESGQIVIHPIYGPGKGPSYRGPYRHDVHEGEDGEYIEDLELLPDILVTQLHRYQRSLGRQQDGVAKESEMELNRQARTICNARVQALQPERWARWGKATEDKENGYIQPDLQPRESSDSDDYEPFWGGPSGASTRLHTPEPISFETTTTATSDTVQEGPVPSVEASSDEELARLEILATSTTHEPSPRVKTPTTPINGLVAFHSTPRKWKEPPPRYISPSTAREKQRAETREQAKRGEMIDLDDD